MGSKTAIGAGVGGAVGAALLILILGFVLLRRRRRARDLKMLEVSPGEGSQDSAKDAKTVTKSKIQDSKEKKGSMIISSDTKMSLMEKKSAEAEDKSLGKAESSSSSVRSEPLPTYDEATDNGR